eukprot:4213169-Pyramimonas_sp.AAC.1
MLALLFGVLVGCHLKSNCYVLLEWDGMGWDGMECLGIRFGAGQDSRSKQGRQNPPGEARGAARWNRHCIL